MIQGGSHFRKVITVLAVTYLLNVNAATDNQHVINEINKLENYMKNLKTPPEMIDALLKQVEAHCQQSRKTIDQSSLTNASRCIEQHLNASQVADDMRAAIPEGKMDAVFGDMCRKWPKVKSCMNEFFIVVEDCWQKGDKVSKFVDEIVRFYCGDDNGGERIAIFFAEGGLECIETHGNEVKQCVEGKQDFEVNEDSLNNIDDLASKISIPKKDQVCESVEQLRDCAAVGLRKCKDPTPENLMTSMLTQVGKALECKLTEAKTRSLAASAGSVNSGVRAVLAFQSILFSALIGVFAI